MGNNVSQQQWLVIVFLIVALVVAIGIAASMGSSGEKSAGGLSSGKRFTAKSGTSRDNAVALTSRNRGPMSASGSGSGGGSGGGGAAGGDPIDAPPPAKKKSLRVRSLSPTENEHGLSESEQAIESAKNSLDPEDGLRKLREQLESAESDAERSKIYAAMAALHADLDPPDYIRADQMYDLARTFARDPASRTALAREEAGALVRRGDTAKARQTVEAALREVPADTVDRAALHQMMGAIQSLEGQAEAAAASYKEAFATARRADPESDERETLLRQAGLMLSRAYRAEGDAEAAQQVADELNEALGRPLRDTALVE